MKFEDKVFSVLRNFLEYGNYGGKIDKAVAVIRKSYPDRSKEDVTYLFENCVTAYQEAISLVRENVGYYSGDKASELEAELRFRKKHSSVPEQMISWIIGWIYHWHHER